MSPDPAGDFWNEVEQSQSKCENCYTLQPLETFQVKKNVKYRCRSCGHVQKRIKRLRQQGLVHELVKRKPGSRKC